MNKQFDKKILCIGSESQNTDEMVSVLAEMDQTKNHGLISAADYQAIDPGYYHTTIVDLSPGEISLDLAPQFDMIKMLDQSIDSYPHWKTFVNTYRLMVILDKKGLSVDYRDNLSNREIIYWHDLLHTNKSLCALPFINLINDYGSATLCMKHFDPITKIDLIKDWSTDPAFAPIRNSMLKGEQIPERCRVCYEREDLGEESARQFESLEWVMDLRLKHIDDLTKIRYPVLYEIRPSNKCNIMCRMCDDKHSHLIEQEHKKLGWPIVTDQWKMQDFPYDKIDFDTVRRIYWAGGEPTIMPEFYAFLRRCIKNGNVDFDLNIGSNMVKISDTLLDLLKEFPRVNWAVSIDGYGRVNDYIRWGSDFDRIVENCHKVLDLNHVVSFQTVFSMWNATRIHEIFEFYDREFPKSNCLVQPAGMFDSYLGPWHNPLRQQVLESMKRCRDTKVYYNVGRNTNDTVEEVIKFFENYDYDKKILKEFFDYNDALDRSRSVDLADYVPELAQARKFIL